MKPIYVYTEAFVGILFLLGLLGFIGVIVMLGMSGFSIRAFVEATRYMSVGGKVASLLLILGMFAFLSKFIFDRIMSR